MKKIILLLFCIFLTSCSSIFVNQKPLEQQFNINQKTGIYKKPVVQMVKIPAMIRGGVYIPEHYEYVVVQPGEYVLDTDPLIEKKQIAEEKIRKLYQIPMNVSVKSLSGGDSVVFCLHKHLLPIKDGEIQVINIKDKPFLIKETISCYGLYEKEPFDAGKYAFSIKYDNGEAVFYWITEKQNEIIKKRISSSDDVIFNEYNAIVIKGLKNSIGGK